MKLSIEDVKDGEEYYVYALRISPSGRVSRKVIPQKSKFIKENNNAYIAYTLTCVNPANIVNKIESVLLNTNVPI